MKSKITREDNTWIVKIFIDKTDKKTRERAHKQLDDAFEMVKELNKIEKIMTKSME